jgi:endonuclease YncB( thermonuclease family)
MFRTLLLGACLATVSHPALAAALAGRVAKVHDGDTLSLLIDQKRVRVRLAGIDAPEMAQAYGPESQRSLADLCFDREAVAQVQSKRRSGLPLVHIRCDGVDANAEQVNRGMAWVDRTQAASPLRHLLEEAQRNREGLWDDAAPVAPWVFRRESSRR